MSARRSSEFGDGDRVVERAVLGRLVSGLREGLALDQFLKTFGIAHEDV